MPDLRDAFRALRATPIVTAVAILSLALGIGANTAIFSLINALMLRSLPVQDPHRLVQVMAGEKRTSWSNPLWEQVRARDTQLFAGAFAYSNPRFNLASGGETQFVNGIMASGGLFHVLGVPAMLGRTFTPADDARGGGPDGPVAVISYAFWRKHFGGGSDVIGRFLALDRVPFSIIGVAPPQFTGIDQGNNFDVAVPLGTEPLIRGAKESALDQRSWWWLRVIARLKDGDSLDHAVVALRTVQPQMREATLPQNARPENLARYLNEPFGLRPAANGPAGLGRQYRDPLFLVMGVVALVLLIACANIANLLLARANARRHELSVRVALGASRWRIARQLLVESTAISAAGAVLGLAFARWGAALLVREFSVEDPPITLDVGIDWAVLAFTALVAMTTTLLFGTVPAMRATRVQPNDALKEQGRSIIGESRFGFASVMVVLQVALSLVLVVGAGLFIRTFTSLTHVHLGFNPDPLLIVEMNAKRSRVAAENRPELWERMRQAALSVPGVQRAALQSITPLTFSGWNTLIENPPGLSLGEEQRLVNVNAVSRDWFATQGIPFIAGRDFTVEDEKGAPVAIVVNETLVKKYFAGGDALGRSLREITRPGEPAPDLHIVGVVRDAVYLSLKDPVPPTMYRHVAQTASPGGLSPGLDLAVQAAGPSARGLQTTRAGQASPAMLSRSIADALQRVDRDVTLTFRAYRRSIRANTVQERMLAMLSGFFGALALFLAALGLYGVMTYGVSRRRTEIGIRMALGAAPSAAVRLVLQRAAVLVGLGVVLGAAMSLWAVRFAAPLLFGLQPRDPATLAGAAIVLALIAAFASWIPAGRAARIDPARVLREG
ncbi:MAG TPA: ABC transporter permease [Gemmatimonadaceae bacterium]|nr:ABC transporter permease [Gemmatimonadaceae bacterium]